jgi:hypothetical protein
MSTKYKINYPFDIVKKYKDSDKWLDVGFEEALNYIYLNEYLPRHDAIEALEQGSILQSVSALYKKK